MSISHHLSGNNIGPRFHLVGLARGLERETRMEQSHSTSTLNPLLFPINPPAKTSILISFNHSGTQIQLIRMSCSPSRLTKKSYFSSQLPWEQI